MSRLIFEANPPPAMPGTGGQAPSPPEIESNQMSDTDDHKTVGVTQKAFVFNEAGKVLIIHRTAAAPSKPNSWDLPGGGIDFGEDPIESIKREIMEETGLKTTTPEPFDLISKINDLGEFWVSIAYRVQAKSGNVKLSFEHDDFKWVEIDEIPNFTDSKRFIKFLETHKRNGV
jgi:8-oxo-dGTP diphosphatase